MPDQGITEATSFLCSWALPPPLSVRPFCLSASRNKSAARTYGLVGRGHLLQRLVIPSQRKRRGTSPKVIETVSGDNMDRPFGEDPSARCASLGMTVECTSPLTGLFHVGTKSADRGQGLVGHNLARKVTIHPGEISAKRRGG